MPILGNLKRLVEITFKSIKLNLLNMFNKNITYNVTDGGVLIVVPDSESAAHLMDAIKRKQAELLTEPQPNKTENDDHKI